MPDDDGGGFNVRTNVGGGNSDDRGGTFRLGPPEPAPHSNSYGGGDREWSSGGENTHGTAGSNNTGDAGKPGNYCYEREGSPRGDSSNGRSQFNNDRPRREPTSLSGTGGSRLAYSDSHSESCEPAAFIAAGLGTGAPALAGAAAAAAVGPALGEIIFTHAAAAMGIEIAALPVELAASPAIAIAVGAAIAGKFTADVVGAVIRSSNRNNQTLDRLSEIGCSSAVRRDGAIMETLDAAHDFTDLRHGPEMIHPGRR